MRDDPDRQPGSDHLHPALANGPARAGDAPAPGLARAEAGEPSGPSVLSVRNLRTGYPGGPDVLNDVSFAVHDGEMIAVLGRNGAGKTTLLRAISGLLGCRNGDIEVDGRSVRGVRAHRIARLGVGHVPEGRRVMPGMSVQDNLLLGAFQVSHRSDIGTSFEEVLGYFPTLRNVLKARAGTLSGGQQQMLAIARAMMPRPKVLLLDEPLTGLAPVIQDDVMSTLAELRAHDRTIVLVEQNAKRSLAIADRGVVLSGGVVSVSGGAEELLADPAVREGYLGAEQQTTLRSQGIQEAK